MPLLLIDERLASLRTLEEGLASPQYELVCAASPAEAVDAFAQREFALTLLAVEMPTTRGLETASQLQRIADRTDREAPIFFLAAGDHPFNILDAYEGGAVDFLHEPFDAAILRAKVASFARFYRSRERLRLRLEEALRAREGQLAVVAHDLRNPLNTVLLATSQLERMAAASPAPERAAKAAGSIVRAVGRMTRLVGDLLDVAKLDAGQSLPLEIDIHDLGQLVRAAADGNETLARARRLALTTDAADGVLVACDGDRLQQVLANLLDNAIKFTPEGGTIHVSARRTGDGALVTVTDTGTGMSEGQLGHIFEAYWQQDAIAKRGAGLGLAIARAVVEAPRGAHLGRVGQGRRDELSLHASVESIDDHRQGRTMTADSEPIAHVMDRVPSGLPGLDRLLGGGFFRSGVYMLLASPGSGKTILGNQMAFAHVAAGGRALFVTLLTESHARLIASLQSFTFFDPAAVGSGLLYVTAYPALEKERLNGLLAQLRQVVRDHEATLLVIDGFVTAGSLAESEIDTKKFIHELQVYVELVGCTTLLLTGGSRTRDEYALRTMVDGPHQAASGIE